MSLIYTDFHYGMSRLTGFTKSPCNSVKFHFKWPLIDLYMYHRSAGLTKYRVYSYYKSAIKIIYSMLRVIT